MLREKRSIKFLEYHNPHIREVFCLWGSGRLSPKTPKRSDRERII